MKEHSVSIIMPKKRQESGESKTQDVLTEDNIKAIKAGGCNLYAIGRITYRDIFGHPHWRHGCGYWRKDTPKTFDVCRSYNDGDEDYPNGKEP